MENKDKRVKIKKKTSYVNIKTKRKEQILKAETVKKCYGLVQDGIMTDKLRET